jgi:hypothetical protein
MQYFERPRTVVLKGGEAVAALKEYILELQRGEAEELTQEQTDAMIKLAKALISTIKSEKQTQPKTEVPFLPKIKCAIEKSFLPLIEQIKQLDFPIKTDFSTILNHAPPLQTYNQPK